jgi:DNA-binding PadR family transcriptional regulator
MKAAPSPRDIVLKALKMYVKYPEYADEITRVLKAAPGGRMAALDLGKAAGMNSDVFYPVAKQMETEGTLESAWDDTTRPRRLIYSLPTK